MTAINGGESSQVKPKSLAGGTETNPVYFNLKQNFGYQHMVESVIWLKNKCPIKPTEQYSTIHRKEERSEIVQ